MMATMKNTKYRRPSYKARYTAAEFDVLVKANPGFGYTPSKTSALLPGFAWFYLDETTQTWSRERACENTD